MRSIQSYIRNALFNGASQPNWTGRVQAVSISCEGVPMVINGAQYMLEFTAPDYGREYGSFDANIIKNVDGGDFFPMLEHRHISLWFDIERSDDDGVQQICAADPAIYLSDDGFAPILCQAFLRYFQQHPQVAQYFFMADELFAIFLQEKVFPLTKQEKTEILVLPINELARPHYGFTVISTNGGHHG